ncbi:MAG: hypothetical protein Q7J27_02730, partial [Syntrophales bacterium]|nr:hypothetical protein [Syntrophales bacterium]
MKMESFAEKFNAMLTVCKHKNTGMKEVETKMQIYYECLKDIPDDLWDETVKTVLFTQDFFPTINEIRKVSCGLTMKLEGRPLAESAWTEALVGIQRGMGSNDFGHPDIEDAISAVGGRDKVGYASLGYELDMYHKRFVEYYNQLGQDRQK